MFELDIQGFGVVRLENLVSDFTGTLSVNGKLLPDVADRLNRIADFLKIHILTGANHDIQKEDYVKKLGPEKVVAFGNGNNDRKMLKAARIGIAVSEGRVRC